MEHPWQRVCYTKSANEVGSVRLWCEEEIGLYQYTWIVSEEGRDFYFKTEEDKVKFILRWL